MKTHQLYLKGGNAITKNIVVHHYETSSNHLDVASIILETPVLLFIEVQHEGINTLLHLGGVTTYELWYFDEKGLFTGKGFSLHTGTGAFAIETQARFILLMKCNEEEVLCGFTPTSFAFSDVLLTSSALSIEEQNWHTRLSLLNDEALIAAYNKETLIKSWTSSRAVYLSCLKKALLSRNFDSTILFTKDADGKVLTFSLAKPVSLVHGALVPLAL